MKLQFYVLRQLLVATALALSGIGFLVFPGITIQAVHKLEGAGLNALLVFIPMLAIELAPYLVPLGFLLGVVATFGRLAAENEWTAIRMSGTNPLMLLVPPLAVALLLSGGTGWVVHELAPEWKFAERDFKRRAQESATALLRRGRTEIEIGGFYLKAQENPADYTYRKVLVYIPSSAEPEEGDEDEDGPRYEQDLRIAADQARFEVGDDAIDIYFQNLRVIKGDLEFESEAIPIHVPIDQIIPSRGRARVAAKYNASSRLLERLRSPAWSLAPETRSEYLTEVHRRSAFAVTYVLFLLIGFPTGIWLRKGSQLAAFATAVSFALVYYVLALRVGKELGSFGRVEPWIGAWATNAVGGVLGVWATMKTLRR